MAEKQYLGIYLTDAGATVALVTPHGRSPRLNSCFWTSRSADAEGAASLADSLSRICVERQFVYESSALALDRCFYTRHRMHSQFREFPRIAETVKFDAEEAITIDTTNLAVTFDILRTDNSGSDLSVYAADKKTLSIVLGELQAAGLDPLTFEPDAVALARFLGSVVPQQEKNASIYAFLAAGSCTIVTYIPGQDLPDIRSFIVAPNSATETLVRELTLTIASLKLTGSLSAVRICDQQGRVDFNLVHRRLGIDVTQFDLAAAAGFPPALMGQGVEPLALAVACGAAMADFSKGRKADFRADFSPYLGRTLVIDKTIKAICLALTFIVIALGLYFQLKVFSVRSDRRALANSIALDYKAAMHTEKVPPISQAVTKLTSELRAVRDLKSGMLTAQGQATVTTLLTRLLEIINTLPASVDLQLNQIKITPKAITLDGSTNRPDSTIAFLQKVGASPYLSYSNVNQQFRNGRDEFGVTILPKRRSSGAANASQN